MLNRIVNQILPCGWCAHHTLYAMMVIHISTWSLQFRQQLHTWSHTWSHSCPCGRLLAEPFFNLPSRFSAWLSASFMASRIAWVWAFALLRSPSTANSNVSTKVVKIYIELGLLTLIGVGVLFAQCLGQLINAIRICQTALAVWLYERVFICLNIHGFRYFVGELFRCMIGCFFQRSERCQSTDFVQ